MAVEPRETRPAGTLPQPFDPIVWDRRRFEHLWGWAYRFEAYTPEAKRQFGYYAMPLLWGDRVIGWVNLAKPSDACRSRQSSSARRKGADFIVPSMLKSH